jgi:hypothetical protein
MRFTRNAALAAMVQLEMAMVRWLVRYRLALLTSGKPLSAEQTTKFVEQLPKGKARCRRLVLRFDSPRFRTCYKW